MANWQHSVRQLHQRTRGVAGASGAGEGSAVRGAGGPRPAPCARGGDVRHDPAGAERPAGRGGQPAALRAEGVSGPARGGRGGRGGDDAREPAAGARGAGPPGGRLCAGGGHGRGQPHGRQGLGGLQGHGPRPAGSVSASGVPQGSPALSVHPCCARPGLRRRDLGGRDATAGGGRRSGRRPALVRRAPVPWGLLHGGGHRGDGAPGGHTGPEPHAGHHVARARGHRELPPAQGAGG
mmetsp:Transcript_28148/g.44288  ORF Transcript_28148/g.44288 Transcript_28148/m.44288 type:complete len:237 (+) Transcript_28148:354-1064(+)